jgi:ubiquinone biosynthesis protein
MGYWEWLIGDAVIGALLPECYAHYRGPIVEGLRLFLNRLPGDAVAQILHDQAALPAEASPEERIVALAERCPALHKLGQILARDRRLAPELRRHLQRLESLPPATPLASIQETLASELGRLDRLGVELEPPALAEASVAVVIPFRLADRSISQRPLRGVFKMLKPGIEARLECELGILQEVGSFLDDRCAAFGIPPLDYREVFDQVRDKLGTEINLRGEQHHLERAAETYAREPEVQVPRLFPFCSRRVTAMERIEGHKVTEPGSFETDDRRRIARLMVEALIAGPIWSRASQATFHADPHAGNLFVTPDCRLALLDWSLTGTLGENERIAMTQLVLGGLSLSAGQVHSALVSLALEGRVDEVALDSVVDDWLRRVRLGTVPGVAWLMGLLDDAVVRARIRVPTDLLMFRKVMLTLEGVLADVSADVRIDDLLAEIFLRRLMIEWPRRLFASPLSRAFETRLSNGDLALLLLRLPWTPARAWIENALETLARMERWACATSREGEAPAEPGPDAARPEPRPPGSLLHDMTRSSP